MLDRECRSAWGVHNPPTGRLVRLCGEGGKEAGQGYWLSAHTLICHVVVVDGRWMGAVDAERAGVVRGWRHMCVYIYLYLDS